MDKLVERETATRNPISAAPALAVQFFLIPLAVVGITVTVYVGFRSLLTNDRTPQEYLSEVRNGGSDRRWPAAYELSRLMGDPKVRADRTLGPELVKAFEAARDDDPRVRQYLALAIGRLTPPIPLEGRQLLLDALNDKDSQTRISAIWALGATHDATAVPAIEQMYASDDAGVRKMVVYALGSIPGDAATPTLVKALDDPEADVQWNAAIALARHGSHEATPVLRRMLDRDYVERNVTRQQQASEQIDPVGEVMISGLRAIAALKESALSDPVKALSQNDSNLKVRQAATETLKSLG